ncbi:MAG TPA: putative maltokinase [Nitrospira sp.]|nr:putative maltokinase [Nitrospira sp.]
MPLKSLKGTTRTRFEAQLPDLLAGQRWFGGKARRLSGTRIVERIPMPSRHRDAALLLVNVAYEDGDRETYVLPVASAFGEDARRISQEMPRAMLTRLAADETEAQEQGLLYDAMWDPSVVHRMLLAIGEGTHVSGEAGTLKASSTTAYEAMVPFPEGVACRVLQGEQSNTSVVLGDQAILKLYRRAQSGMNPDWEIGRYLTSRGFRHSPPVGGALEYVTAGETTTVALLQAFIPNAGDAWAVTLKELDRFLTRVQTQDHHVNSEAEKECSLWDLSHSAITEEGRQLIGPAFDAAVALAERTAALHLTLGQGQQDPAFAPEPLTDEYLQARHHSMTQSWKQALRLLRQRSLQGASMLKEGAELPGQESRILGVFQTLLEIREGGQRIRCHGDYHLGQVLWTGSDYVITDFEGEPARPLQERRLKHSPLYDVAGMLRSFDYAAWTALVRWESKVPRRELEPWTTYWSRWVRAHFLRVYMTHVHDAPFWPASSTDAARLLTVHQLEKAVYEFSYEMNNRPEWMSIPLKGINEIIQWSGTRAAA